MTLTPEEQAADRLRRWEDASLVDHHEYDDDPCQYSPGGDRVILSEAWLREHPADDTEALSESNLRKLGFQYSLITLVGSDEPIWEASLQLDADTTLRIREDETLLDVGHTYWPCERCEAVGDVRRLCQALGIELGGER